MTHPHRRDAPPGHWPLLATAGACTLAFWCLVWFSFPAPFTDEAWFIPPGLAFADHGDFQTDMLHPSRALHWMPVGFFVLSGLFVKLVGVPGLYGFRLFSSVVSAFNLGLAAGLSSRRSVLQTTVLLAPFVTMPLLTMSRLARMDSLTILLFLAAALACGRRRAGLGVAIALVGCVVHPNGLFAVLAAAAWIVVRVVVEGRGPVIAELRRGWWQIALALCIVAAYAGYEALHWADYRHDMAFQMQRKQGNWHFWQKTTVIALLVIPSAGAWIARQRSLWSCPLWLFGSGLMLTRVAGQEVWYTTMFFVGTAMVVVAALDSVDQPAGTGRGKRRLGLASVAAGSVALAAIFVVSCGVVGWNGDRLARRWPGAHDDDQQAGRAIVAEIEAAPWFGRSSLSCLPWYECLLLVEDERDALLPVRLLTPITAMPIGQQCVTIERERNNDQWSLQRGPIRSHTIAPCPADWPKATR